MADSIRFMGAKADRFVAWTPTGAVLDYSDQSLNATEAPLAEASRSLKAPRDAERAESEGVCACRALEAGRRQAGGGYVWHPDFDCPAPAFGEPAFSVAVLAHETAQGLPLGDEGGSVPFHRTGRRNCTGWCDLARRGTPGDWAPCL